MPLTHKRTREGDETVCSCGLRWGLDEGDPHGVAAFFMPAAVSKPSQRELNAVARQHLDNMKKDLSDD